MQPLLTRAVMGTDTVSLLRGKGHAGSFLLPPHRFILCSGNWPPYLPCPLISTRYLNSNRRLGVEGEVSHLLWLCRGRDCPCLQLQPVSPFSMALTFSWLLDTSFPSKLAGDGGFPFLYHWAQCHSFLSLLTIFVRAPVGLCLLAVFLSSITRSLAV